MKERSTEHTIARRFHDKLYQGDFDLAKTLLSQDVRFHLLLDKKNTRTLSGPKSLDAYFSQIPRHVGGRLDPRHVDVYSARNFVLLVHTTGKYDEKKASIARAVELIRFEDSRITEVWMFGHRQFSDEEFWSNMPWPPDFEMIPVEMDYRWWLYEIPDPLAIPVPPTFLPVARPIGVEVVAGYPSFWATQYQEYANFGDMPIAWAANSTFYGNINFEGVPLEGGGTYTFYVPSQAYLPSPFANFLTPELVLIRIGVDPGTVVAPYHVALTLVDSDDTPSWSAGTLPHPFLTYKNAFFVNVTEIMADGTPGLYNPVLASGQTGYDLGASTGLEFMASWTGIEPDGDGHYLAQIYNFDEEGKIHELEDKRFRLYPRTCDVPVDAVNCPS